MNLAIVYSRACVGIKSPQVTVEIHISRGMPGLHIVGLPAAAVKESKDRVRSALLNSGLDFPRRRITVNLAPADLPKEGGRFDLPIALGILAASGQIPVESLAQYEFTGELALTGELRRVPGVLPMVLTVKQTGRQLIVPAANAEEAALMKESEVYYAEHLLQVCQFLKDEEKLPICNLKAMTADDIMLSDLRDVKGQQSAKYALEIAAAGKHSLLFMGSPGTGKTMLANRLSTIVPKLTEEEALEVAAIYSVSSNGFNQTAWGQLPFRYPHHSSSSVALVGGGRPPHPGEISLAHHGILFLDELPEFNRTVLEALREPLESGHIVIARAGYQISFPAKFQLIAAMNPCPCGYAGSAKGYCHCTHEQIHRYIHKISGPLLDRIDMQVTVPEMDPNVLMTEDLAESSATVQSRVIAARDRQLQRQGKVNSELLTPELSKYCELNAECQKFLTQWVNRYNLSARSFHRILRLARTIADLKQMDCLSIESISEAIIFKPATNTVSDKLARFPQID